MGGLGRGCTTEADDAPARAASMARLSSDLRSGAGGTFQIDPDPKRPRSLEGILRGEQAGYRLEDDLEVEEDRPVFDVEQIAFHAPDQMLRFARRAAVAVDLRPAGNPGLDPMTVRIGADDLVAELVLRLHADRVRPGADQRHVALEHVQQLRQFVEARAPQDGAEARDA